MLTIYPRHDVTYARVHRKRIPKNSRSGKSETALMCTLPSLSKSSSTQFSIPYPKKGEKEAKRMAKENKLEKKAKLFTEWDFSCWFLLRRERQKTRGGKSIFAECQVLSYDKMKWVWDACRWRIREVSLVNGSACRCVCVVGVSRKSHGTI